MIKKETLSDKVEKQFAIVTSVLLVFSIGVLKILIFREYKEYDYYFLIDLFYFFGLGGNFFIIGKNLVICHLLALILFVFLYLKNYALSLLNSDNIYQEKLHRNYQIFTFALFYIPINTLVVAIFSYVLYSKNYYIGLHFTTLLVLLFFEFLIGIIYALLRIIKTNKIRKIRIGIKKILILLTTVFVVFIFANYVFNFEKKLSYSIDRKIISLKEKYFSITLFNYSYKSKIFIFDQEDKMIDLSMTILRSNEDETFVVYVNPKVLSEGVYTIVITNDDTYDPHHHMMYFNILFTE